jgi:DDE superfamily endonuclease
VLGFADEVWWSRFAQPDPHAWAGDEPLRLVQRAADRQDTDPKALACYGPSRRAADRMMLRFVEGRPVSTVTRDFLAWACGRLAAEGKRALLLVWDDAAWHVSRAVRAWVRAHNRMAKREGGVRIVVCQLPVKAPWLNPIEPKWVHGKRAVAEPGRKLAAAESKQRVCDCYRCELVEPIAQKVA